MEFILDNCLKKEIKKVKEQYFISMGASMRETSIKM